MGSVAKPAYNSDFSKPCWRCAVLRSGQPLFICASQSLGQGDSKTAIPVSSPTRHCCACVSQRLSAVDSPRWVARLTAEGAQHVFPVHDAACLFTVLRDRLQCTFILCIVLQGWWCHRIVLSFEECEQHCWCDSLGAYFPLAQDKIGWLVLWTREQWGWSSWDTGKLCRIHPALWWWMDTPAMCQPS